MNQHTPRDTWSRAEAKGDLPDLPRETRRQFKARIQALADADWNAIPHEPDPRRHAARHLASLPAERRAMLEAEWNAKEIDRD